LGERGDERRLAGREPDAHAWGDQLGERRHVQRSLGGEREDGRLVGAAIAQQAIWRVLDDEEAVLPRELGDVPALPARACRPGGVLEFRGAVEKLRHTPPRPPLPRPSPPSPPPPP